MALERQSIEKKDFPIGRRGYEPEAVDSHLASLADQVDELKRSSRQRTETLASSASEQVQSIVAAAEASAAAIQRQAEDEAREILGEAKAEAQSSSEQAAGQAREYVGQVSEATAGMLQRVDAMEAELTTLVESLRTGSNRLNADLQLLEGNLSELRDSAAPRPNFERESALADEAPAADGRAPTPELARKPSASTRPASEQEPAGVAGLAAQQPPAAGAESDDLEGARLIALNMALNGTPREETDLYLAENFRIERRDALLDEVYASLEG